MATSYSVIDTLTLRDSLKLLEPGTAFSLNVDVLYQTDTLAAPTLGLTVLATDTITFSDVVVDTIKFAIPIPLPLATPDRIVLIDEVSVRLNAGNIGIFVSDLFNFRDLQGTNNTNNPGIADALSLSDGLGRNDGWTISPDSLSLSDTATNTLSSIFLNLTAVGTDGLNFVDTLQIRVPGSFGLLSDTLRFSDSASVAMGSLITPYIRGYLNDV